MRACLIRAYGGPERVQLSDLPEPQVGASDVLIEMRGASINPVDFKIRAGKVKPLLPYRMPLVLGSDVAGVVRAVGHAVSEFKVGDRVAARLSKKRIGALAELVLASPEQLAKIPATVEFDAAAAVALAGLTAWQCLTEVLQLSGGQRLLIHAGAGGVGHLAVQLAKHLGAHVTATASSRHHDWLQQLGADHCVDYASSRFEDCPVFDAVLDGIGGETLLRSLKHTRSGGRVVSIGDMPTPEVALEFSKPWLWPAFWMLSLRPRMLARRRRVHYRYWFMREDGKQLAMLLEMLASGRLKVEIAERYSLEQAPDALLASERGRTRGKLVVTR
jgi:alcohol dehydrogenase